MSALRPSHVDGDRNGVGPDLNQGPGLPPRGAAVDVDELAELWVNALRESCSMTIGQTQLRSFLSPLASSLVRAFTADVPDLAMAEAAGAALVQLRVPAVDLLPRSMPVFAALASGAEAGGAAGSGAALRLDQLRAAFIGGFVQALQDRVLSEQESIQLAARRALLEAQRDRSHSQRRLQAVFDAAAAAIAICDLNGNIVEANRGLAQMTGRAAVDLTGRSVLSLLHPDDRMKAAADIEAAADGALPIRADRRLDGHDSRWVMLSFSTISAVADSPGYLVVVGEDITERQHLQQTLQHQALHDALTGLPNRTLLHRRLRAVLREAAAHTRVGLYFIDLDDFKAVNDTLGHSVGDRLLVALADRLRQACTDDHFVARVGGDEFVVIAPCSGGENMLAELADRILYALSQPVELDFYRLSVSASIGIVEQPAAEADAEQMLRAADATLYLAKADGRGRWAMFDTRRNNEQLQRYEMLAQLPEALNRGEFRVLYQPLVSLRDNVVRGVEALLRWENPKMGAVSPSDFIPIAEHTDLIIPLGRWVLNQACRDAVRWRSWCDVAPFVSVNVSMRQVGHPGFADDVKAALASTGLPPHALQLELTETAMMLPAEAWLFTLRQLAELGVRIAIDDFGIGYSNLARLRSLPIHGLKLAGDFMTGVRSAELDHIDEKVVATVVALAHALDLTVTAEGVETRNQAQRVISLGCDLGQGWLYGGATTAQHITQLLEKRRSSGG